MANDGVNDGTEATQKFQKSFDKCPACGSAERFFESIVKELKEKGKVEKDWEFFLDLKQGPVATQQQLLLLPIGAQLQGYVLATDICSNCGCIYAVKLMRVSAKKGAPIIQPNRAERRRFAKMGDNPLGSNNPLLS